MTEERAREILIDKIDEDGVFSDGDRIAIFTYGGRTTRVEGRFTADELEAIAFWMRRGPTKP